MRINEVVDIEAPPERVWPYLTEPDKIMGWFATAQLFRWTSEPGGVGSTFRWVEETAGRNASVVAETTEWQPPNVFGFRMTEGDFDAYEARWTVEPTDTGCRVATDAQIKLSFGSGMLFSPLFAHNLRKRTSASLQNLKHLAEQNSN
jgi:uncharacterized protein YndB with AHSA1/START domain